MDSQRLTGRAFEARRSAKLMRRVLSAFAAHLDEELRGQRVTTAQLRFLHEVRQRPGGSGAQLARACHVTPQSANAMMARAVERGWVVRGKDAENSRLVTARLTRSGERLLAHADGVLRGLEAKVWAGAAMAELRAMNSLMEGALRHLEQDGRHASDARDRDRVRPIQSRVAAESR